MYYQDHNPPHFHAKYAEYKASFSIATGELIEGHIPKTAQKLIKEWQSLHQDKLMQNWEKAQAEQIPDKIEPLE